MNLSYDELSKGLDFQSLGQLGRGEKILSSIEYSRPLKEYATPEQIASFMRKREGSKHIYTKDLQVSGLAVQDSMEKYLSSDEYLGSSVLKEAYKTPKHFYYAKISGQKEALEKYRSNAQHFDLGTFLHMCCLEPSRFGRVVVEPKANLSSLIGVKSLISFWEAVIMSYPEALPKSIWCVKRTPQDDLDDCVDCCASENLDFNKITGLKAYYKLLKSSCSLDAVTEEHKNIIDIVHQNYLEYGGGIILELMKHSKREISLYFTDPKTGLKVKCRPDAMQFSENIGFNAIISVKSTKADTIAKFSSDSATFNYELSEGMYQEVASCVTGRDFNCTLTIMLQNSPPYAVSLLVWDGEDIEIGKKKYRKALNNVAESKKSKQYQGFEKNHMDNMGLIKMKQPSWNARDLRI